jgi:hypothetical protein
MVFLSLACGTTAPAATATRRATNTSAATPTAFVISYEDISIHVGERIIVEGYIQAISFQCETTTPTSCYADFSSSPDQKNQALLRISVSSAIESNTMKKLPEKYSISDVAFYDKNLQKIVHKDHIRVTGKVYVMDSGFDKGMPYIAVEVLELLP